MGLTQAIDITAEQRRTILALLNRHLPGTTVWACGSRVKWTSRPESDLDLVAFARPEQSARVADLREAFEESNLPFRVDLFVWDEVPEGFKRRIEVEQVALVDAAADGRTLENWLYHPRFPAHWGRRPLYSMAQWVNGLAFRDIKFSASGRPVIKIAEIKGGISNQTKFTNQNFDESVHVRTGDLLFSWSGQPETSIDAFWWRGPEGWLNQHIFRVTPLDGINTVFFFYLLRYLKPNFVAIARNKQTTGLGHVTKHDLENIKAALPEIHEQRVIAHVLGTLDDKIELNRRMNETLEAMARALFKSWFVDFDPVRAKMEGRDPGLPKPIADLFPDRLVDSELGRIPDGWKLVSLDKIANATKGRSYRRRELAASDTALVTLKSFARGGGYRPDGLKPFRGVYKKEQVVHPGEVIVACTDVTQAAEVVGRSAVVGTTSSFRTLVASLDVLIVRPKDACVGRAFVYYLTGTEDFVAHTVARTTGTTVLHLSKDAVTSFQFALPSLSLVKQFTQYADSLRSRIHVNESAVASLTHLRDTLLPKLVSGEIRLRDAARQVESVA